MTSDAWLNLIHPNIGQVTRLLVAFSGPIECYVAIDHLRRHIFVLTTTVVSTPKRQPLAGANISVDWRQVSDGSGIQVTVQLLNMDMQDLFTVLCNNLAELIEGLPTGMNLFDAVIIRVQRWQRLLDGGRPNTLSDSERRGLIGELLLLEQVFIPNYTSSAVHAWLGPTGNPQDFVFDLGRVECKSYLEFPFNEVKISSLDQLDDSYSSLTLALNHLLETDGHGTGVTLNELVSNVERLLLTEPERMEFNSRLLSAGYEYNVAYESFRYVRQVTKYYKVSDDFPRLNPSNVNSHITKVTYSVPLIGLDQFLIPSFDSQWQENQHENSI
jgi:hypothetical protein